MSNSTNELYDIWPRLFEFVAIDLIRGDEWGTITIVVIDNEC